MYASVRASKSSECNENFTRQGSLRRVLPSEHNKETIFTRHSEDVNKLNKIYRQEYLILAEYKMIQSENIPGVYVIPSRENSLVWFGVVFVRSGIYEEGVFRFTIQLSEYFPDGDHPKVMFQSEVLHPMIDSDTKELYLIDAFPTWCKGKQHIWQVLKYIQWIFYRIETTISKAINSDATEMYLNDREMFTENVQKLVKLSKDRLYDEPPTNDKHYITFQLYDPEIHDKVRNSMLTYQDDKNKVVGHSWVLPGSFKSMGRPASPQLESES